MGSTASAPRIAWSAPTPAVLTLCLAVIYSVLLWTVGWKKSEHGHYIYIYTYTLYHTIFIWWGIWWASNGIYIANWYMIWVYQNTEKALKIDLFIEHIIKDSRPWDFGVFRQIHIVKWTKKQIFTYDSWLLWLVRLHQWMWNTSYFQTNPPWQDFSFESDLFDHGRSRGRSSMYIYIYTYIYIYMYIYIHYPLVI